MSKSDCGLSANSGSTEQQVSEEERIFRWKYMMKEYPDMSIKEFNDKIDSIRKEIKRP